MTAYSSKGVQVYIFDALEFGAPVPAGSSKSTVTQATNPAGAASVLTYSGTRISDGDFVRISQRTGLDAIDNKTFIAASSSATAATLVGSKGDGAANFTGSVEVMPVTKATAIGLCLTSIDFATVTPNTISIATFCDPAKTIDGPEARGQMTIAGQVDATDPGYQKLANLDRHGKDHPLTLAVELPDNQGWIFQTGILSSIDFDLPLDGVVGFQATIETFGNADHRY